MEGRGESVLYFFFQAEDGIRDWSVTGVQDVCSSDLKDPQKQHPAFKAILSDDGVVAALTQILGPNVRL